MTEMRRCALGLTVLLLASVCSAAAQTITEFPVPTEAPMPAAATIAAGPDGALWFTAHGRSKIARITTTGTVTEFLIPVPGRVFVYTDIALGPDGALWFGIAKAPASSSLWAGESGSIIRITTTGEFREFLLPPEQFKENDEPGAPDDHIERVSPLPTRQERALRPPSHLLLIGAPKGMTAGLDGALWFTESDRNKIGRITTAGEFSEFLLPTPKSRPIGITAGPDGALWFTEIDGNKIGRIATTGAISEFVLPTPKGRPFGITAGPDRALWFTENAGNKIGRITTTGEFSEFPLPTPDSGPRGITVGSDGAVWFTEFPGNKIGRITTAGEFSEFVIPTPNSGSVGITTGPDGAVWFTERDKIGRIGQPDEDVKADLKNPHWERWILYLAIVATFGIIIAEGLRRRRFHLH